MKTRFLSTVAISVLSLVSLGAIQAQTCGQIPQSQDVPSNISTILDDIKESGRAKNYRQVLGDVKALQQKRAFLSREPSTVGLYYQALQTGVSTLMSVDYQNSEGSKNAQRDAQTVVLEEFANAKSMPLKNRYDLTFLIFVLSRKEEGVSTEKWRELRRTKAEVFLTTWRELNQQLDPAFDPNDAPVLDNSTVGFSDPKKQSEYEAQRAKAQIAMVEKSKRFNRQIDLRNQIRELETRMKSQIVLAYSTAPFDTDELLLLLKSNGIVSSDLGKRILTAVGERIQSTH